MSEFPKGTIVVLSELGKTQRILPRLDAEGIITSPYPSAGCVTVQWNYKKTRDRMHVSFLAVSSQQRANKGD